MVKVGLGQDSHSFTTEEKTLILGGVIIQDHQGLLANSDGDVVLHSITNAISSVSTINILGARADEMCKNGITDSSVYLLAALKDFEYNINHIAISIECLSPKLSQYIDKMRKSIALLLNINMQNIGITATTGEGLSAVGCGKGIFVTTIVTVVSTI